MAFTTAQFPCELHASRAASACSLDQPCVLALQLGFAYRDVDEAGKPLRRDYNEVARLLGLSEERCRACPLQEMSHLTCRAYKRFTSAA